MRGAEESDSAAFLLSAEMGQALKDPWRSRVLMELSVGPLSPRQFQAKHGGELPHISRCFRVLANLGYAEVVEVRRGGERRGAEEKIYRLIRRAHLASDSWESLPREFHESFSGSIISSFISRVNEAMAAGTLDGEADNHLSWDALSLDRTAWTQLVTRLDAVLAWLPQLEIEANRRLVGSGEVPIPTTVALAGFRSPEVANAALRPPRESPGRGEAATQPAASGISLKAVKAAGNRWRSLILMELSMGPLSPTQFVAKRGGSLQNISRCFRQLAAWGLIEIAEGGKGGRGVQRVYRSVERVRFDSGNWTGLPRPLREEVSLGILESFVARIAEAVDAGTFDDELDSHFSWDSIALDRVAWDRLMRQLDELFDWTAELEREAMARIAITHEEPIPTTAGLTGFRSPAPALPGFGAGAESGTGG